MNPTIRRGFTLVECLVAVTLLAVGMLALSATTLTVERTDGRAARRDAAATLAWARLEALRGTPCAARANGGAAAGGIAEHWRVLPAPGLTLARDSLVLPPEDARTPPPIVVAAALPC